MAQIQFNPHITGIVGKIGQLTYSRNQSGYVVKSTPYPSKRKLKAPSSSQIKYRGYFSQVQRSWIKCSQQQMEDWHYVAKKSTFINKFGAKYPGDGYHLFLRLNQNRLIIGQPIYFDAPNITYVKQLNKFSVDATPGSREIVNIFYDATESASDTTYIIYATYPLSPGINYTSNQYRNIGILTLDPSNVSDITTLYTDLFGVFPPNKKIFFKLTPVSISTGIAGLNISNFALTGALYPCIGSINIGSTFIIQ